VKKLEEIFHKIKNIKNINILELGVHEGISTKMFLQLCDDNQGKLISVDIKDCSKVSNNKRWTFIHSSDDNFDLINSYIKKDLDVIFIDSLHEPNHVKKVFYNYYKKLKIKGLCIIDDISWLPYVKNARKDNDFTERVNKLTFQKILEISNANEKNFALEFFFKGSGLAIITKNTNDELVEEIKIPDRSITFKNFLKKIYSPKPKN
jgi:predicted O-methyltransferase YrrM